MNSFTRIGLRSRFLLVLMIGLILPMLSVWGQNATITGKVVDPKGEPLVGVSVLEQGTTNGTVTDMNGRYSIVVQKDSSPLRFSYMGFDNQEIVPGKRRVIDVTLTENSVVIDDVVVIAYGTKKRRDMIGSVSKIKSDEIRQRLLGVERVKQAKTICTFISAFKEPDTVEIIKELWEQGKKVVVPITDIESGTLSLSYINSMDDMKKGAYGILEPKTVRKADENNIDVILVPGLAFDRNGGRMGFGKGYYDRLLESSKAVKIGLCYDFQILEKIPTEIHDVPMNFVITEKEILEIR